MSQEAVVPGIFEFIIRGLNPPILAAIMVLIAFEWLTHRKKNWSLLLAGWMFNLVYLYFETFGSSVLFFGVNVNRFVAINLSLLTSALFLAYALIGDSPQSRLKAVLKSFSCAALAVALSVFLAKYYGGSIWSPFRTDSTFPAGVEAIVYTPLIVFSFIATLLSAYSVRRGLGKAEPVAVRLIGGSWTVYAFLQLFYYLKFFPNKLAITLVFGLAFLAKLLLAVGLFKLYRDESQSYYVQKVRQQYEGRQQLAFSWFAHELKHPVFAIRLSAETLATDLGNREYSRASKVSKRLLDITSNLVTVIESVKLAAEPFDSAKLTFFSVNDAIEEALGQVRLIKAAPGSGIRTEYAANLLVCAVKENLVQVFSNLLRNGLEAIESAAVEGNHEISGDLLAIETKRVRDEDRFWVRVRVTDFGPGIPAELVRDIFEPYFSTKRGVNRGLGLWVVRNFLEAFGGRVSVSSPPPSASRGTMFEVFLPLVSQKEHQGSLPEEYWRRNASVHMATV